MRFIAPPNWPGSASAQPAFGYGMAGAPAYGYGQQAYPQAQACAPLGDWHDPDCFVHCRNASCYASYSACVTVGDRCDEYAVCNDKCVDSCMPPGPQGPTPAAPAASASASGEVSLFKLLGWT